MSTDRDEIRDHLQAVIEAARELPRDDRAYLADTFLDDLEKHYRLVPRDALRQTEATSRRAPLSGLSLGRSPLPIGLVILLAVLVVPLALGALAVAVHPPIILLAVLLFLLFRSGAFRGPRHRRPRRDMIV